MTNKSQNFKKCIVGKADFRFLFNFQHVEGLLQDSSVRFSELIEFLKETDALDSFLYHSQEHLKKMYEHNIVSRKDLIYILHAIDKFVELNDFCHNAFLLTTSLRTSMLGKNRIQDFNHLIQSVEHCGKVGVYDIFDLIAYYYSFSDRWPSQNLSQRFRANSAKEILNLSESYRCVYLIEQVLTLSNTQKNELNGIFKNSEKSIKILKQLASNNVVDQYNYEQLKKLLIKDDNKKKLKLNF